MAKQTTSLFGVVAFLPTQPQAPMRESLEWLTDLLVSQNGTEQPIQLRGAPRQRFTYTIPEQEAVKNSTFNVQYGALAEPWAVPVWAEAQYVGSIASALTTLSLETDLYDFRDESLAFIYESPTKYQLVEIDTVGSDELTLLTATGSTFTRAWVMPVRRGRVVNNFQRASTGYGNVTDVTFDIDDNVALDAGATPEQFLSNDIYFTPPYIDGPMQSTVTARIDVVDYDLGPVVTRAPWLYNRVGRTNQFICEGATEIRAFRQWLARRAGRKRKFWEPSFENDLRKLSTGTVTSTFIAASDSFLEWGGMKRNHVAFELDDGTWLPRTVSSATQLDADRVQLNLSSSLGGINANRIRRVSYLGLKRLDTDRVELQWLGGNVMKAAINVIEISP